MFAIVDCNNFYASCERVFRPELNGKPIVVLSNNDGCVIARSNEAKLLGIPMGAPAFKFKKEFAANNINVFSSNYALYGDMSSRVMTMLSSFTPDIEIYSIDEAFLKLDGFEHFDIREYGLSIRKKVTKGTGIPVSIGIAYTKALTKVANRIVKKFSEKTEGVYIIDTEEKRIKALKWLPINDVWGIGSRHAKRLKAIGVTTAYKFTELSDDWVKTNMSIVGLRLKRELEGKSILDLEEPQKKKSIATTRTFEQNYTDFSIIKERVSTFSVTCSEKLRQQKSVCNSILVFLRSNSHRKDLHQYNRSIVVKLPYPTNSSIELSKFALHGLQQIFKEGYQYKKAGVVVMDLVPENLMQISLFENSNPKHKQLMNVVDRLNNSIGQKKIKLASQDLERTWKMKQERLSPRYTTNIKEIITVKTL